MDIAEEQHALRDFARERAWEQFHTPKNLAMALAGEVGELVALFQWLTPKESRSVMNTDAAGPVREELADVFIYLARLADVLDVDLTQSVEDKIARNAERYTVDRSRGSAQKR